MADPGADRPPLPMDEVLHALCWYDPRHPSFDDTHGFSDPEDIPAPRRRDCGCDSCFYGKDRLAVEIIRLRGDTT